MRLPYPNNWSGRLCFSQSLWYRFQPEPQNSPGHVVHAGANRVNEEASLNDYFLQNVPFADMTADLGLAGFLLGRCLVGPYLKSAPAPYGEGGVALSLRLWGFVRLRRLSGLRLSRGCFGRFGDLERWESCG